MKYIHHLRINVKYFNYIEIVDGLISDTKANRVLAIPL